jgi:hypothetical protein
MSPTSCRCSTPRREREEGRGRARGRTVRGGVPRARAAFSRELPPKYFAGAGGGHDRVRDGTGWIAAAIAHARHPAPHHRIVSRAKRSGTAASKIKETAHRPTATWATRAGGKERDRPRPCAPLRSDGCPPSTRGRSTRWSAGGLTCSKAGAICHLPVGFPLRCAQRFSHPDVATRRCCFGNNRHTSGRSSPVLSY